MSISARDEQNQPVDMWFAYKVPKLTGGQNSAGATGYEYAYYDRTVGTFTKSPNLMNDKQGALFYTLDAVFGNPAATFGWVLYNDEMPADADRSNNDTLGHTKGIIAFDTATDSAFWLLHSWPKYASPAEPGVPTPLYGQTFMCLSLDLGTAGKLAAQMALNQQPQVYLPRTANLPADHPLTVLTKPLSVSTPSDSSVVPLSTRGGASFKVIAKNRKWGKDFWNDLVGPTLGADMDVETWIRGKIPPILDSDGVHKTFDVKYIDLRKLGAPWAWPETQDHAKWGITTTDNWVCVGDINRMVSQEKRGGGTIALQDPVLWKALSQTDTIIPPPGKTSAQALEMIQATHTAPAS
ncbi:deoxyribonuclease II family protein [Burkholderia sp. BE17]|uniref:deoxyribonuclease II family protein n=1 Tax=Burkholderia sp. BE17 TaxID=2656644 RepID=UPI00128C01FA|nr:deoxyribonuclease II family protein [Burkholderia sp. BE17]MPV68471.1 deoxyribonuclease [Burkholderia sp. BE17]